jgi:hypothetical protein
LSQPRAPAPSSTHGKNVGVGPAWYKQRMLGRPLDSIVVGGIATVRDRLLEMLQ